MFEIVIGILSGLASAVTVAGFLWAPISSLKRELKKLETERIQRIETDLQKLATERIDKLEVKWDKHTGEDCSQRILAKIETILNEQEKMDAKLDRIAEDTAKQSARIEANASYIGNLDKSFQQHKITGGHHHGSN